MSKQSSSFLNLVANIIVPTLILTKFSSPERFGPFWGLIIAILFPIGYGIFEYIYHKKINFFSIIGLGSVLLTGGIGLLSISPRWLAIKEAAVPGVIGCTVIISTYTKYPVLKLFFQEILDMDLLKKHFSSDDQLWFEQRIFLSSLMLGGTFFVSAVLNFLLATWIVVSHPGTEAFNKELGMMNMLSFPVIALPMTVMMMFVIWFLLDKPLKKAGISWEEFIHASQK